MKKKLIAAILSVALVTSLVPATAFATDSQAHVKSNVKSTAQVKGDMSDYDGIDITATTGVEYFKAAKLVFDDSAKTMTAEMKTLTTRIPADKTFEVEVTKPDGAANAAWSIETQDANNAKIEKKESIASGTTKEKITITNEVKKIIINDGTDDATVTLEGVKFYTDTSKAASSKIKSIVKTLDEKYDEDVTAVTGKSKYIAVYSDYNDMFTLNDAIYNNKGALALSAAELAELKALTLADGTTTVADSILTNFDDAFKEVSGYAKKISDAKTAISQIPTSELQESDSTKVKAATDAVDLVKGLENGTPKVLGKDASGTALTTKDVIGASLMTAYDNAVIVDNAVKAIKGMAEVTPTVYKAGNYESATVNTVIAAVNAAKKEGLSGRIGNLAKYNKNMDEFKSIDGLIDNADLAVKAAERAAKVSAPYTQDQLDVAKTALKNAIAAVKAVPLKVESSALKTFASDDQFKIKTSTATEITEMDTAPGSWVLAIGSPVGKYKYVEAKPNEAKVQQKIAEMETALKSEAKVADVVKLIKAMPAASALAWTDKDKMFELTTAFDELKDADQTYLKDAYYLEGKKFEDLKTAQEKVEKGRIADAATRLTSQINSLPSPIALTEEDAIEAVRSAYKEYETGYLNGTGVLAAVSTETKTKYATAMKTLDELIAARTKDDEVVVKAFHDLMTPITAKVTAYETNPNDTAALKLSDKAYVTEARAAYDKMTKSQQGLVADVDFEALESAEQIIAELSGVVDKDAVANQVIVAIRALPAASTLTTADAQKVYAVNDQYLAGIKTEGVKELITNRDALFTAVGKVMDLEIAALPTLKADGTDTVEQIKAAAEKMAAVKATFDKIGTEQQGYVTKKDDLTKAVAAVDKAIIAHSDAELKAIAAFDFEKELTAEQLAQIKAEKACIDVMTKEQIAKLNQDNYKIFTEKALKALEASEEASISLENAKIEGLTDVVYNGKAHTPAIKVTDKEGKEIAAENYTVKYYSNKNVGQATVLVTAVKGGAYTGAVEATFIISPAKAEITSLQVAKAKLRVNIKPMSNVNYRIAYKPTSAKSYKGQNTSLTSKVLPGIKAKTKYTVKVRAYIKEDGKTYFGAYSPIKHATTK